MPPKKISFHTLGCRLNLVETGTLATEVKRRGYHVVPFGEPADLTLINTCTVTHSADRTSRHLIRKAARYAHKIAVMGCYSQENKKSIAQMNRVDLVLGTKDKGQFLDYLDGSPFPDESFFMASGTFSKDHTRAFLKIQDGCNYVCSFCIIPRIRGRSRTCSPEDIIRQAQELTHKGFKEIVLTGVNLGEYEKASGTPLEEIVKNILKLKKLKRLRLSSIEPNTITKTLLKILSDSPKSMDHFHLPLQSGDDSILKMMKRKYDTKQYGDTVENIFNFFPHATIGADIITGFPGETQLMFQNTYRFLEQLPLSHFHVFPYSKRRGTLAEKMPGHLSTPVKKERTQKLIQLGERKKTSVMNKMNGSSNPVLFENKNREGRFQGYTTNYLKVSLYSSKNLQNTIVPVRLKMECNQLTGSIVS